MEAFVDANGKMKPAFLTQPTWNVFVKVLLTQLDCLCLVLSWCIAIYLAICRAILFFIVDLFPRDEYQITPKEPVDGKSSPRAKPDDDNRPNDNEPAADGGSSNLRKLMLKRDSGLSSFDSGSSASGSPVHLIDGVVDSTNVSVKTDKDLKSTVLIPKNARESSISKNVEVQK